jgi:hypothetical protein
MLKIGVHHAGPQGARAIEAANNRAAEPSGSLAARSVDQDNFAVRTRWQVGDDVGRLVVAVIDKNALSASTGQGGVDPAPELGNVGGFVPRWDDEREVEGIGGEGRVARFVRDPRRTRRRTPFM